MVRTRNWPQAFAHGFKKDSGKTYMSDWDENPDNYAKDANGEFILKVDGTPRKKSGRAKGSKSRGYN